MRSHELIGSLVLLVLMVLPAGCTNGPTLIINSHIDYNKAVRQVMNEELLLNIVRMRYAEAPQFVAVSSINTQFETTTGLGSDIGWLDEIQGPASWGVEGSLAFKDNPTISITPRQGEEVAKQLLSPIDPQTIAYLSGAGYRLDNIFALLVENANGVRSYTAAGTLPTRAGDPEFGELLAAIHVLEEENDIVCGFLKAYDDYDGTVSQDQLQPSDYLAAIQSGKRWRPIDPGSDDWALHTYELEPVIWISKDGQASEAGQVVMNLLNLDPEEPFYWLDNLKFQDPPTSSTDSLRVRMRSFYGVMNLLSLAVEIPPGDLQAELVLPGTDEQIYDVVIEGFLDVALHVHEANNPPPHAWVAVKTRGYWFYIDDSELSSKRTFTLAIELLNLQISDDDKANSAPILTIPIG
ncbi:MAG: hypothetical protein CMJ29_01820 [Phycisphaerae bacterium]|nr:hypothetical protein [Phycisphaerae bacterium]MAT80367.1 hypothetical protein [Phycisphaerae bacterium]|tara:strand:- start:127 stop:1350 length:1224 start_codon:yes stop_codon:yes gene_type:complete